MRPRAAHRIRQGVHSVKTARGPSSRTLARQRLHTRSNTSLPSGEKREYKLFNLRGTERHDCTLERRVGGEGRKQVGERKGVKRRASERKSILSGSGPYVDTVQPSPAPQSKPPTLKAKAVASIPTPKTPDRHAHKSTSLTHSKCNLPFNMHGARMHTPQESA